ncbi:hypothetical protein J1614_012105 [Plenodomus biglobosus]|nr:hypothetical protein J1614_012105 [Plenodomus biglobosus]
MAASDSTPVHGGARHSLPFTCFFWKHASTAMAHQSSHGPLRWNEVGDFVWNGLVTRRGTGEASLGCNSPTLLLAITTAITHSDPVSHPRRPPVPSLLAPLSNTNLRF